MKKKSTFTAVTLRNLMTFAVIVAFLLTGAGFYYAFSQLQTYASQVHQAVLTAYQTSTNNSSAPAKRPSGQRTLLTPILSNFFAPTASYQTQATQALTTYAQLSGLKLGTVSARTPSTLTVSFSGPISYTGFLTFLTYVEHSLPKMNVTSLSITRSGGSTVTVSSLTIEVAVQ